MSSTDAIALFPLELVLYPDEKLSLHIFEPRYREMIDDCVNDEKPFARGINSIQLLNDGNRWWIMNIYWSSETEANPIPDKYLSH